MKILLVDDEPIQRRALHRELSRLVLPREISSIREAGHGRECLELVQEETPDVIFLDLRMPVMGGLEVASALLPAHSTIKIIFLTAFDDFSYAQEAVRLGALDYLLKPASREDLAKVMNKVCGLLLEEEEGREERRHLILQLEKIKPFIELEYMNEIVEGLPLDGQAHSDKAEVLGLKQQMCWCLLLDVEYGAGVSSEPRRQALKQQVHDILRDELGQGMGITGRLGFGRLACVSAIPPLHDESWCMLFAERLRDRVHSEANCSVSVGVSRRCSDPVELYRAANEARQALEFKYVYGTGQVLHVDDVDLGADLGKKVTEELAIDIDKRIGEAMRLGDTEQLSILVQKVAKCIYLQGITEPTLSRFKAVELFVLIVRAAAEGGASQQAIAMAQERLEKSFSGQAEGDVGSVLATLAQELAATVKGLRNQRNQRLMLKAIDYIRNNYSQQITLDDLARQVYLSPFYFSHIFREEMNTTFIEYLTMVRIEAAKEKLRETVISVGVIAEQVGYNDVNYFSRVFKKVTGQTPTQYREKMFQG